MISAVSNYFDVSLVSKAPTYVGLGGVKVIAPTRRTCAHTDWVDFVAHGGEKWLVDGEDQTQLVLNVAGLAQSDVTYTKPMMEAGAGVVIPAGACLHRRGVSVPTNIQH